jgi:hypothetical protein
MGSDSPMYVQFPDTGYTVVAKANSAGWFPVYTNQYKLFVIGLGIDPNNIPTTKVLVTNIGIEASTDVELESSVSYYLASPVLQRSGQFQPGFGVPALGDQESSVFLDPSVTGSTVGLFGTPLASGKFVYITCMYGSITLTGAGGGGATTRIIMESTGISGIFFLQDVAVIAGQVISSQPVISMNGQWKLDASQTYRMRTQVLAGLPVGAWNFSFSYTVL